MKKSIDAIIKESPDFKPMFDRYWDATKETVFLGSRALGLDADLNPLSPEHQVSFIVLTAKIYTHIADLSLENIKKQKLPALSDHERKFFGVSCDILRYQFTKALPFDEHSMTSFAQVCLHAPHQQDENLIKSVLKQLKAYVKKNKLSPNLKKILDTFYKDTQYLEHGKSVWKKLRSDMKTIISAS